MKIHKETVKIPQIFLFCIKCKPDRKITGSTERQLLYNLRTHMEAKHGQKSKFEH